MTVEEMIQVTNRLKDIRKAPYQLQKERLYNLIRDVKMYASDELDCSITLLQSLIYEYRILTGMEVVE